MFQNKKRASSKLLLVREESFFLEESFVTFGCVAPYSAKIEEASLLATEDRDPPDFNNA